MNTYLSFIGITVVLPVILAAAVVIVVAVIIILVIFYLRTKPKVSLSLDQEPDQRNI